MAVLAAAPVLAQETGTVAGTVTLQENGGAVGGAVVLVVGSGKFALTDEQGGFVIDGVPAGSYEVLAQREHLTAGRQTVDVRPDQAATVDFVLELSPVQENVTVTASVGGTETSVRDVQRRSPPWTRSTSRESRPPISETPCGTSRALPSAASGPERTGRSSAASTVTGC